MKTKNMVVGGMLTGLAIMIPLIFAGTPLMITIPPEFTATIASHVPSMIAMAISPGVAIMVGIGSAIGFTMRLSPIIGARALTHSLFGGIGALLYKRGTPYWLVLGLTLPIHALAEGLVLLPFGINLYQALFSTSIGTAIHHIIDSAIALALFQTLIRLSIIKRPIIDRK